MRSLAFSLRDGTVNVLTICRQISRMCNLAFSLLIFFSLPCVLYIRFTLHVLLIARDLEQLKGEVRAFFPYFDCFHVS